MWHTTSTFATYNLTYCFVLHSTEFIQKLHHAIYTIFENGEVVIVFILLETSSVSDV
jgi:hypothetical protein